MKPRKKELPVKFILILTALAFASSALAADRVVLFGEFTSTG